MTKFERDKVRDIDFIGARRVSRYIKGKVDFELRRARHNRWTCDICRNKLPINTNIIWSYKSHGVNKVICTQCVKDMFGVIIEGNIISWD